MPTTFGTIDSLHLHLQQSLSGKMFHRVRANLEPYYQRVGTSYPLKRAEEIDLKKLGSTLQTILGKEEFPGSRLITIAPRDVDQLFKKIKPEWMDNFEFEEWIEPHRARLRTVTCKLLHDAVQDLNSVTMSIMDRTMDFHPETLAFENFTLSIQQSALGPPLSKQVRNVLSEEFTSWYNSDYEYDRLEHIPGTIIAAYVLAAQRNDDLPCLEAFEELLTITLDAIPLGFLPRNCFLVACA